MKISRFRALVFAFVALICLPALFWAPTGFVGFGSIVVTGLLVAALPLLFIAAEVDAKEVARPGESIHPILAGLVPGSGRGALFLVITLTMVFLSFVLARAIHGAEGARTWDDDPTQLAAICMFGLCYALLPALATGFGRSRRMLRVTAVVALLIAAVIAMPVGEDLVEASRGVSLVLIPPLMVEHVRWDGGWTRTAWPAFVVLCGATGLLLAVSLPHMMRGVRELRRPRDEQREPVVSSVR